MYDKHAIALFSPHLSQEMIMRTIDEYEKAKATKIVYVFWEGHMEGDQRKTYTESPDDIIEVKILDTIQSAISFNFSSPQRSEDGHLVGKIEIKGGAWSYIRLIDAYGREWYTNDNGETWHFELLSFCFE